MGGFGSGRWYRWSKKHTENNFWLLSVKDLKKHARISKGQLSSNTWNWCNGEKYSSVSYEINTKNYPMYMRVHYTNKDTDKHYDYKIFLVTTKPHYGGERWWFICPAQNCGRCVSILYLAQTFACRHCHNIAYMTQNEAPPDRLLSKSQKIHHQLGGNRCAPGENIPPKPKGMHWKTYNRKVNQMKLAYFQATKGIAARLRNFRC